ncbi:variable surface protein Vir1/9, putative [Plasmodium vivax]|uniref:Variable surface protein Vir1/9, putative n=3 Tax=Plasmodium vivax TaxID=5855 RepID=A5KCX8_PLAVS|nr:variable surface protein Vir1/9, putative [Plasmodium vivax]EDL42793.1 variable surface protein Vir1/9, putative [Plasmodium vivax]KMZ92296.1 hypothetical protein PVMG_03651 [Plasmodium vivax Mauritania I]|eukprot:XP_001612584.1 variable surface protein Vir1/9 [Plasmodium vivax Sal-1]
MGDSIFDYVKEFLEFKNIISSSIGDSHEIYRGQCDDFRVQKLRVDHDDDQKFLKFCANSGYHVTDKKKNPKNVIYPFCIYMIYWIYREMLSENVGKNSGLVKEFFDCVPNSDDCEIYVDKIDQDIYEKLKTLYDLYTNFNKFKTESLRTVAATCENGPKCVALYNEHAEKCNKNYNKDFCVKLIDFKKEYEEHMEKLTNCESMPRYLPSIGSNIATSIATPVVSMSLISFVAFISYKVSNDFIQN